MCNGKHDCSEILGPCDGSQGFKRSLILWPVKSNGQLQGALPGGSNLLEEAKEQWEQQETALETPHRRLAS